MKASICAMRVAHPAALAAVVLVAVAAPPCALGDGGFVAPFEKDVWEPHQKAIILYDGENQTEDLILQAGFEGDTKDFSWIVPVPSLPTFDTAETSLFWECASLTRPLTRERGSGWGCADNDAYLSPDVGRDDSKINIYDDQIVGIYQVLTLGADDPGQLADSLEAWGFLHEANEASVEEALQFYIDKSWYFVAMRIDSTSGAAQRHGGYWYGGLDPIRLTFSTPELVYPMRISAISTKDLCEVLLYVCAPHRMTYSGAATEYANLFDASELADLREHHVNLGQVITKPCFMTKLRRTFTAAEMTDDLILERAPTDAEFRKIEYTGLPSTEILFLAMAGILVTRARRARRKRSSPD